MKQIARALDSQRLPFSRVFAQGIDLEQRPDPPTGARNLLIVILDTKEQMRLLGYM